MDIDYFTVKTVGKRAVCCRIDVIHNALDRAVAIDRLESGWMGAAKSPGLPTGRIEIRSILRRLRNDLRRQRAGIPGHTMVLLFKARVHRDWLSPFVKPDDL